ncbi:hypothetical protein FRC09_019148, partial [Ceratobasidium sp. 395]
MVVRSSKSPVGANWRRKAAPKEIHAQAKGSLPLSKKEIEEALRTHTNCTPQPQPQPQPHPTDNELPESLAEIKDFFAESLKHAPPLAEDSERLADKNAEQK